ncbi:pentapeptide repeat-containing protein [Streptomyces fulvoviolaceus]|uniref:pentapeptide repeat-containing protein n=1 Tax=Streptomyces fulvoviolaceus TaxID=285535 RepID=UPI0021C241C6|nr:pentapeptide repeat-containing protein [Streptomyces fulvoviolaceus]MCT9075446.1 pentapeptide repeat-containing protein [Streptomyces fulvoviolaceus]
MSTPPAVPPAPSWPYCAHGADSATDPVGCRGIHVPGHTACLAHLTAIDRDTYLAGLAPGADIDHRGTPLTEELLNRLLHALHDPTTAKPRLGNAGFDGAQFFGTAGFDGAQFSGDAWFGGAQFSGVARFGEAQFSGNAGFSGAQFSDVARFVRAQFSSDARFGEAQFSGNAAFVRAQFSDVAWFGGAQFSSDARFGEAQFSGDARFGRAQFSGDAGFVRAQFSGRAGFSEAQFSGDAWFNGAQFSGNAAFVRAQFSRRAGFSGAQFSGDAGFARAQFSGGAGFGQVQFSGDAGFVRAQFCSIAGFTMAQFSGNAEFVKAQFSSDTRFVKAQFFGGAGFGEAQFSATAGFSEAQFFGGAEFARAQFSGDTRFGGARFSDNAGFTGAQFSVTSWLGPVVCAGALDLSGAVFEVPVTLEIAAREVHCVRTRWESTATVRLRYATADFGHAVLSAPVAVTTHPTLFTTTFGRTVDESFWSDPAGVQVASVRGVDAAHLVLTDIDLRDCLFSGAFHLDQLRLEGLCTFAPAPLGWHRNGIRLTRWTRRRTLAEEHHWRAQTASQPAPPPGHTGTPRQWRPGPHHPDPSLTPDPEDVAALYRQLRKAFEDGKNEPGAADFYYGECEMRRHDHIGTPKGERCLLWGYWLLSGYGLRASRAFTWLLAAMSLTVLLLMGLGLPTHDPAPATTGTLHGNKISLSTTTPDPALPRGFSQRFTWPRTEKATRVAVNSVIFRSSGQNLTTAGTYIEMTSRLLEPTLLALAVLAIRGRIKR